MSAGLGLAVIIVLGRGLGDAGAGVILQAIAIFTIALGAARFGMDSTSLWLLPRLSDDHPELVPRATWFLVVVSALMGTLCAIVLLLIAPALDAGANGNELTAVIRTVAPFLPAAAMLLVALTAARALGRVTAYVWVGNVALPTLRLIGIVAVIGIGIGFSLTGVARAWAAAAAVALIPALMVLLAQTRRYAPGTWSTFHRERIARRCITYALPRVASSTLEQILIWVTVLGVGAIAGSSAAGVYGAASRFIAAGLIIDVALRVVVAPMFSRLQGRGDRDELLSLYRTATVWLVLFSTPVFVLLAIFAPVALSVIGPEFVAGDIVLMIMCAGALTTFLAGNVHSILLMSGRSGLAALNKLIVVIVTIVGIVVLTPVWGIVGAALAWATAAILDAALATAQVRWILQLPISLRSGVYPLVLGVVGVGIPAIAARALLGPTWAGLAVALIVGGAGFLTCCLTNRDRFQLHDFALRIRPRPPQPQHVPNAADNKGG